MVLNNTGTWLNQDAEKSSVTLSASSRLSISTPFQTAQVQTAQPQPEQSQPEALKSSQPQPSQPQPEAPKSEQPQPEAPKSQQPQPPQPQPEAPKSQQPQPPQPQPEVPKSSQPQPPQPQPEAPKPEQPQPEPAKSSQPQPEQPPQPEPAKSSQPQPEAPKSEQPQPEPRKSEQLGQRELRELERKQREQLEQHEQFERQFERDLRELEREREQRESRRSELIYIGDFNIEASNFVGAETAYREAILIHPDAILHDKLGNVLYWQGKIEEAIDEYRKALQLNAKYTNALKNLGQLLLKQGNFEEAITSFEKAKDIFQKQGKFEDVKQIEQFLSQSFKAKADHLTEQGNQQFKLNQFKAAVEFWQQALTIYRNIDDRQGETTSLGSLGKGYHLLGQYQQAIESYQQSLTIAQDIGDRVKKANALVGLGTAYNSIGQYQKAIKFFEQSLIITQGTNNPTVEVDSLMGLGNSYYSLEQYQGAIDFYKQSLAIANNTNDRWRMNTSLNALSNTYIKLGQYEQAIQFQQHSLAIERKIQNRPGETIALNNLGEAYAHLGNNQQAIEFYQQSLAVAQSIGDRPTQGLVLSNIGEVYYSLGQYANAEKMLTAAIQVLESLRPGLTDADKVSIFEKQADAFRFLQQALIAQNKTHTALEIAERSRARAFVDLLASKLSPIPNNQPNIKPPNIEQIKQIASQHSTTLVEYSVINEPFKVQGKQKWQPKLYIWVVKPTGEVAFKKVDLESLDIPLQEFVINSRQSIGARGRGIFEVVPIKNPVNQKQNLQKLHQLLIDPIADLLPTNPNEKIIFIPHESLFLVPFPALIDANGKYLIEKHTILTAPAIQVLEMTHQQQQRAKTLHTTYLQDQDVLVVGNPTMPKVGIPPMQLAPLPGAEQEAKAIAKLFNTKPLLGNQATKAAVLQKIHSARIIHLATHGLLGDFGDRTRSAIALAPSTLFHRSLPRGNRRGVQMKVYSKLQKL